MKLVLAWYFMAASALPHGAAVLTTHGPFPTEAACLHATKWATAMTNNPKTHPVTIYPCWQDGR